MMRRSAAIFLVVLSFRNLTAGFRSILPLTCLRVPDVFLKRAATVPRATKRSIIEPTATSSTLGNGMKLKPTCSSFSLFSSKEDAVLSPRRRGESLTSFLTYYSPLLTILAAVGGLTQSTCVASTLGSLPVMQGALAVLMLVMGVTISPNEFSRAIQSPGVLALNAACCFGMMPLLSVVLSKLLLLPIQQTAGLILLGCVSGGQASNLFTLLAGGDVALSVVCTLSTTILGVGATPLLVKWLLRQSIPVNGTAVLRSVASLVLLPLVTGLTIIGPSLKQRMAPLCPALGVLATLILVSGGAASSASSFGFLGGGTNPNIIISIVASSLLLPILGGFLALCLSNLFDLAPETKKAFVVEVFSKSPTLAFVLARKHFTLDAAAIPAAAMVTLAALGALAASIWAGAGEGRND